VASWPKLHYDCAEKPEAGILMGVEMDILIISAATLAVVWIIVLWGSRYFGPR
jgi:hypothetical protein